MSSLDKFLSPNPLLLSSSFDRDFFQGMFVPALKGQGTEEQLQKWLPLATKMEIIGCYAQTELGHGSNVQGLETTATFDPNADEFIIHSPSLTSYKVSFLLIPMFVSVVTLIITSSNIVIDVKHSSFCKKQLSYEQ